jgi:hypothetical protein
MHAEMHSGAASPARARPAHAGVAAAQRQRGPRQADCTCSCMMQWQRPVRAITALERGRKVPNHMLWLQFIEAIHGSNLRAFAVEEQCLPGYGRAVRAKVAVANAARTAVVLNGHALRRDW